jgi:hypothetical protein
VEDPASGTAAEAAGFVLHALEERLCETDRFGFERGEENMAAVVQAALKQFEIPTPGRRG